MANNTNVDVSKSLAELRASLLKSASPEVQAVAKAKTTGTTTKKKTSINPSTYYSGGYSFADSRSVPQEARVNVTLGGIGKPLGEGIANAKTDEGYDIKQLSTTGGRFAVNSSDPSSVVYDPEKAARLEGYTPESMTENAMLRGGLSSAHFQIDHIMPLWLGGTNEVANKILLSKADHEKKSKVEAVARQLWIDGGKSKEMLDQARVLASTWRDKDTDDIKVSDGKSSNLPAGYLIGGSDFATKKLDAWINPKPKLKDYWNSFVDTVTKKPIKVVEAAIGVPATAAAAAVTNLFMPEGKKFDPIKEATKYGSGIMAGTEGMSNTPTFGKFAAGTVKGLTGGWIDPETPEFTGVNKTIGDVSSFAGETAGFISSMVAMRGAAGALAKTKIVTSAAQKTGLLGLAQSGIGARMLQGGTMAKNGKIVDYGSKALKTLEDMGLFTVYGQMGKEGSLGTLLGANENSIEQNTTRIMSDMAMGAITGPASTKWKGFAWVGSGTFALSYLQSAADPNTTNEEDFKNAVSNGVMMMAFHSMGLLNSKKAATALEAKSNQWAQDTRDRLAKYGRNVETDPIPKRTATKIKTAEELNAENIAIEKKINEQVLNGTISRDQAYKYMTDNAVAGHQLWKGGLSRTAKLKEDLLDWDNLGKKAKDPDGLTISYEPPAFVEYMAKKNGRIKNAGLPNDQDPLTGALPPGKPPVGEVWFTDTTTQTTPLHAKNIARYESEVEAGLHGTRQTGFIVPRRDKATQVLDANKKMSQADIDAGKKLPYAEPEKNLGIYVQFADKTRGEVGSVPRSERIDKLPNNQNETIKRMNEARLAEGKEAFPLKDPNLNKNTLFDYMDNNGIPILEVDLKIVRSKAVNSGLPYAVGNISLNGWANSFARGKGIRGISERSRLYLIENMKAKGVPASQVMKSMPVAMKSGDLVSKGLVRDVHAHFTEAVESAVRVGDEDALRQTLDANFGAIADDKLIKAIINKDIKTVGELWNVVGEAIDNNQSKLNDNGRFWQTGQELLMNDADYMAASVEVMDLPLDIVPGAAKAPLATEILPVQTKMKLEIKPKEPPVGLPEAAVEVLPKKSISVPSKPKWREFALVGKEKEGVNAGVLNYTQDPAILKESTRKSLTTLAKQASVDGSDIAGGWPKYREAVESKIGTKITNPTELRDLEWSYKHLANSGTRKELGDTGIGTGPLDNIGEADKRIVSYNRENGLPDDAMEVVSVSKQRNYVDDKGKPIFDSREKFKSDQTKLAKTHVPIGITAKGANNALYVKYEPKLVETFEKDPSRYLNEGEKLTTPQDKFLRVFAVDVLKLPKNTSYTDLVKRSNLIFHRYDQYSGADASTKVKIHILKSKKIAEDPSLKPKVEDFAEPKDPKVENSMKSFESGSTIDGKLVVGEKLYDKLIKDFNYDPRKFKTGFKPLISGDVNVNGQTMKMIQKGHAIKADPALRQMLKEEYGLELGDMEIASFDTNAKIGVKEGTHEIDLGSIYSKPLNVGEEGRLMPSFETKLPAGDAKVTQDILAQTAERRKDFEKFNEEIMASNNKEELLSVIDKATEKYGLNPETLFYGVNGDAFELGASKINLSRNLEKISKNLFYETVLTDIAPNSGRAFMSPPFKLKIDGPGKPARFPKDDEVVLGSEMMKNKSIKEGDEVLVLRDPSYDINNIIVAKAVDGGKAGHTSLGTEHVVVSPFNERARLQGDQDGDTVLIIRVGEGGVPKSYADSIKANGSKVIPFTEVNPSPSGFITSEGINKTISNQLVGDDQTSKIAMINRAIGAMKSNKIKVTVFPGVEKSSKYEITVNGKVVETGETTRSKTGFTAEPKWDYKEKQIRSQALQEAVDSKKSSDIVRRTDNNDPNWMLEQVFVDSTTGENINRIQSWSINKALKNIQTSFNIGKISEQSDTLSDVMKKIEPSLQLSRNIKEAGGQLTPLQEKLLSISDVKRLDIPDELLVKADELGAKNVKEKVTGVNMDNPKLTDIRRLATKVKSEYYKKGINPLEKKRLRGAVEEYFMTNKDKYTPQDVKDISYWAANSNLANLALGFRPSTVGTKPTHYPTSKFIMRYKKLLTADKEVANAYYEGSEAATRADIPTEPDYTIEEVQ